MNVWKITAPQKLLREDIPVPEPEEGKLRVRITKALLSGTDVFTPTAPRATAARKKRTSPRTKSTSSA